MQNLWHACLRRLEQELPSQQFSTWIRPLAPEAGAADSATLVLAVPNRFILEMVRERFAARIQRLASEAGNREIDVKLVLARAAVPDGVERVATPAGPRTGAAPAAACTFGIT